ncbi:MAG TPA: hypothetical protein DGG94_00220, partial [Micromonosporaceae bacterium]|nr:hypothetical protein [Micromonosporaceae bacterium]
PDVDAVYMQATQAMTGQGGWPMTAFATPDGQPFFCGTYYPREHFTTLLRSVSEAWRTQREAVVAQGDQVVKAIAGTPLAGEAEITPALLDHAAEQVARGYDEVHGGFGGAPKFPPHMLLLFLLRHHRRTGDGRSLEIARHTAEAMARGGLFDQVGGGFHRYAVDTTWTVPHFEKMLYDNALLLRFYTELWRLTGDALAARVAEQTADFLLRDLRTAEGGFASALDADTDGVEGLTYAWNQEQLQGVLGEAHASWAADLFGVTETGTFEHGLSVLQLQRDIDDADEDVRKRWQDVRERLAEARKSRPQPARDDKVVASWNGLAITALAEYGRLAQRKDVQEAAVAAGELLRDLHIVDGRLRRVSRDGVVGEPAGVLEDYGCVAEGFAALHQLTGEGSWLERAGELLDTAIVHFSDGKGGFFDTADDAQRLVTRPADPTDNATPSGLSSLVSALIAYYALSGEGRYVEVAERALGTVGSLLAKHPRFAGYSAAAAEALLTGPVEIAIATMDPTHDPLVQTAIKEAPSGAVIVAGEPDRPGVPLLADRPLIEGRSAAYVCRGFVCDRPVTATVELTTMLRPAV